MMFTSPGRVLRSRFRFTSSPGAGTSTSAGSAGGLGANAAGWLLGAVGERSRGGAGTTLDTAVPSACDN